MKRSLLHGLAAATLILALAGCDANTADPGTGLRLDAFSGTYTGTFTVMTTIDGSTETVVRPLAVTVVAPAGGTHTVRLDPGPAGPGGDDPAPLDLAVDYLGMRTALRFPGEPPLILDVALDGRMTGGGDVQLLGGRLDVDAAGSLSAAAFVLDLSAVVLEDLPTAPAGSTQTISIQASR